MARSRLATLYAPGILLAAAACVPPPPPAAPASAATRMHALADAFLAAYFDAFPHEATLLGAAAGPHDRLPDISASARERWQAREDAFLAQLEAIDAREIPAGSAAALTHGFLFELLRNARDFRVCEQPLWNVSPTWTGWQSQIALLANSQPVTAAKNAEAYRRFAELPRYIDQEIANLREGLQRGYSAPHGNVRAVIAQLDALLSAPLAESPFTTMARDAAPGFRARLERLELRAIRPAIQRYREFLQEEYLPQARREVGVSAHPDGEACYRAAIRYYATLDVAPARVHELGLAQMERIRAEMREIARRSFGSEDVDAALEQLRTEPRYLFTSREHKLQVAKDAVERARLATPRWFGIVPRAPVGVEPLPAFSEASAPDGFYGPPAEDGSRPGIYYINLYEADRTPRAGLEATAFHETYPGHHLQGTLALERTDLHPVARYLYLSGFGEGWALYSERLAEEMGLYSSDVDRMGLLSNEALRAARLVVDAGMHALGWSRQQAIDYMMRNTASSEASVVAEVDRYIAVPGQATAYMLGSLEILRLRERAIAELGDAFDIRVFHDRVLEDGAVPLMMLREKMEGWMENR